jgi:hypothetical protein
MFEGVGRRSGKHGGRFLDIGQHTVNGYERNVLFRNRGNGSFTEVGWVTGADRVEDGRGVAFFDVDRDGRLELALRNYRQQAGILRNRGPRRHWIAFELTGTRSNRDAIGARVRLRTGGTWQTRVVEAGSGFLSASSRRLHFGLGDATRVDHVAITWPSWETTVLEDLDADRLHRIEEGASFITSDR